MTSYSSNGIDLYVERISVVGVLKQIDVQQIHLVGLSMGAQVAMQLALDHPQFATSLTMVNSPASINFLPEGLILIHPSESLPGGTGR